ncbi:MAG: type II secretion system GspH family protein, partial [Campylobacter sp.]|uniref:type II secretion system protein n=1 Tax=Campylobacter sp. TaxID=205 RepID=UPI002AA5E376
MIELIFVIVILGILASVAIPRLAGTKEDAEISAAAANLRTLVSDASAYYVVKSGFGTGATSTKWNEFTNVPLKLQKADGTAITTDGIIKIGGKDCIRVRVQNRNGNVPAHILFLKDKDNKNSGACKQVVAAAPIKAYFKSRVAGVSGLSDDKGAVPIGPSTSMYEELAAAKPAAKPAAAKPAAAKPAAAKPAAAKPAAAKPAAAKPA